MKKTKLLLMSLAVLITTTALGKSQKYHDKQYINNGNTLVIGDWKPKYAGFCNLFIGTLNNIAWCESKNVKPIVYWGKTCTYYVPQGYNGSHNVWEYYFEPVSDALYNKKRDRVRKKFLPPDKTNIGNFILNQCPEYERRAYRAEGKRLIDKYIRVKQPILNKVNDWYQNNMQQKTTIGLHLRGTDKVIERAAASVEAMCQKANEIAAQYNDCQFFIATDEERMLEMAKKLLKGKVIYYDSYRSQNNRPIHYNNATQNMAKLGEEMLIEVLLLSRCNVFIHSCTNVASMALLFNPDLENVLFSTTFYRSLFDEEYDLDSML